MSRSRLSTTDSKKTHAVASPPLHDSLSLVFISNTQNHVPSPPFVVSGARLCVSQFKPTFLCYKHAPNPSPPRNNSFCSCPVFQQSFTSTSARPLILAFYYQLSSPTFRTYSIPTVSPFPSLSPHPPFSLRIRWSQNVS